MDMSTKSGATLKRIDKLREALSSLLTDDVAGLPAATQLQCLQALRPAVCQMQALQLRLVGAVDASAFARTQGSASTATWLRNTLHLPKATEVVKSAAALSRLPIVAAAFAAGRINDAHVATIAKVAETVTPQALADGAEELLVTQASQLTPSKFAPVASRIRDQAAPGPRPPVHRPRGRWLRADQRTDGSLCVRGLFDPDSGRVVLAALTAVTESGPLARSDQEAKNADALVELCRRAVLVSDDAFTGRARGASPAIAAEPAMARESQEGSAPRDGRFGPRMSSSPSSDAPDRGPTAGRRPSRPAASASGSVDDPGAGADHGQAVGGSQAAGTARRSPKLRKPDRGRRRQKHHRSPNGT